MKKLRVGFLVDDLETNKYIAELISFVGNEEYFDDPVIIMGYKSQKFNSFFKKLINKFKENPKKFLNNIFLSFLLKIIKYIEIKTISKRDPEYLKKINLRNFNFIKLIKVVGNWSKSKLYLDFTKEDLSLISQNQLDCIVRCGSGIIKGEILNLTNYGVISFHHGDNRVNRGGPSGFWEVFNNEPSSGFIIQKLNQELDGGEVLFRGNIMTSNLWLDNELKLLEKSNIFLKRLLTQIAIEKKLPEKEGVRLNGVNLYKLDSSLVLLKYILTIIIPKVFNNILSKLLSPKVNRWSVAFAQHNKFSKSLWRYNEIKNPRGRFLADPFVFENNQNNYIFVEDLFFKDNKGRISVIKINEKDYEFLGVVLEEDFHLSYPFVFKNENQIYMIPESSKKNDIRLYKCLKFPYKWELDQVLMSDVSATDTMIIKQDNTWYMLTNICSSTKGENSSELHIFYSNELKKNTWKPISLGNPVIFDSLEARNGGIFFNQNKVYRVSQSQGKGHYGKSFNVNEIIKISKNNYIEKKVSIINPLFKKGITSTHHFSANDKFAAVDFARPQRLRSALKN